MKLFDKAKSLNVIKINSLIGKKAIIEGNISGKGNYKIDGTINGDISIKGDLVLGEKSSVTGNITATNIIVAGKVSGDIEAKSMLVLKNSSTVTGNQKCAKINIEDGSNIVGSCVISGIDSTEFEIEDEVEEKTDFEETVE